MAQGSGTPGKPRQTGGVNLYAPKRFCECPNPLPYRDEDDVTCYRCGHEVASELRQRNAH